MTGPESISAATVAGELLIERKRQVNSEHYGTAHDDQHAGGELAQAAAAYCLNSAAQVGGGDGDHYALAVWPWLVEEFNAKNPRRNLIRAGALIIAEIERLDRAAARTNPAPAVPGKG